MAILLCLLAGLRFRRRVRPVAGLLAERAMHHAESQAIFQFVYHRRGNERVALRATQVRKILLVADLILQSSQSRRSEDPIEVHAQQRPRPVLLVQGDVGVAGATKNIEEARIAAPIFRVAILLEVVLFGLFVGHTASVTL